MDEENEHELAVRTLMSVGINFLAVDFDVSWRLKRTQLISHITGVVWCL